jgi:AraC family transcriptional regulator, positive regulator of tynA and feaB
VQDAHHWNTAVVPVAEQFDFWRTMVWEAFVPVVPRRPSAGPFTGRIAARAIGALGAARIVSEPQSAHRTAEQVAREPGHVLFLNLPLTGGSRAFQGGRVAELAAGDFVLVDSARPFDLEFDRPFEQVSFTVPHDLLAPLVADLDAATALRVRGDAGLGAVASAALRAAATEAGGTDRVGARALGDHLVGLIALALGGLRSDVVDAGRPSLLLQLAREEADRSLGDPALAPDTVAARVGISTRYLHRLFSEAGPSFGRWVLARRLERCNAALTDPACAHWTVTQIAFEHGFADPSYFARAFRARYGLTPRERRAGVGGAPRPVVRARSS